jgi:predicted MFS family arabinose efflux permease
MPPKDAGRSPWTILFVVFFACVAASLNQFKVPPVMPLLMKAFELPEARAGLLMSVFAVAGLILAIPAGSIFQRWGSRITGLVALSALLAGAGLGTLSRDTGTMLASRVIEGIGMTFISVAAPAIVAISFSPDKRGKAMGLWATWLPFGSTLMFAVAPLLAGLWGWQGVWGFGFLYTICAGILYYRMIQPQPAMASTTEHVSPEKLGRHPLKEILSHRQLWLLSILFFCFNFVYISFITWAPTFLHEIRGMSLSSASLLVSLTSMLTLISCPMSGWVSDKTGSLKLVCALPLILMMPLFPAAFHAGGKGFLLLVIALGFLSGFVPPGIFTAGVEAVEDERLSGLAMAVIQIGLNAGMLLGPLLFGVILQSAGGWQAAFWSLAPISAMGAVAGWMAKMR